MNAARWPRIDATGERLLRVEPRGETLAHCTVGDLPGLLRAGDVVVVNDAATLPASLAATTDDGARVELRLASPPVDSVATAVLFGDGDWRSRTEDRPAPPAVAVGALLSMGEGLSAVVTEVSRVSPRLVTVRFAERGAALWQGLYRHGRAVQYSYAAGEYPLWNVQTPFAARPWAVEMPSAGRPLRWTVLEGLRAKGVALATITHAAGLSSTGDPRIDEVLPLPERYAVPRATVEAVWAARARGGRVIAVGTSVVRALEGCAEAHGGELVEGEGVTALRIGRGYRPRVVDGVLSGMHEPGSSHYALLTAFATTALLDAALAEAEGERYLAHEFGDSCLVLAEAA